MHPKGHARLILGKKKDEEKDSISRGDRGTNERGVSLIDPK